MRCPAPLPRGRRHGDPRLERARPGGARRRHARFPRGCRAQAYDAIVASGEIALRHIAEQGYERIYCIGPADRDAADVLRASTADQVALEEADAILCTGLNDDRSETADDYRAAAGDGPRAQPAASSAPTPTSSSTSAGRQYLCAGAIADLYERMDGPVFWAGKPHANAYEAARAAALKLARRARAARPDHRHRRPLRTDLKGAEAAGIAAIFVASGIHRDETMGAATLSADKLRRLFAPPAPPAPSP